VSVGTAGQTARPDGASSARGAGGAGESDAADPCPAAGNDPCGSGSDRPDLTWLLHRAAQHMRAGLDEAARAHGLAGARDWIVLSALAEGPRQTQLALAQSLGLDKTTMTSLLDRMESRGLITRCTDSHDRRARIPGLTAAGQRVQAEVAGARDRVEAGLLGGFTAGEQDQLRALLTRLTVAPAEHGSCI
jgi:MarR family transcriptional regulator, organic hydroperoxide resistance regulator